MFPGFPPEALTFFRGLARNNNREWFLPRKEQFEVRVRDPMLALCEALNAEFAKFAPEYINEPKKAIYRIYRDTRFSADKTPYKTHLAAVFPRRGSWGHGSEGFFFSISAKAVGVAAGIYAPSPEQLLLIRTWLAENHQRFRKAARGPEKLMGKLQGGSLQRIPKGFPAEHPAADLIKMKQWLFSTALDVKLLTTPKILPELVKRFRVMHPVMKLLNESITPQKRAAGAEYYL
jgi:uncharacterized protein (TIGR02453 family)